MLQVNFLNSLLVDMDEVQCLYYELIKGEITMNGRNIVAPPPCRHYIVFMFKNGLIKKEECTSRESALYIIEKVGKSMHAFTEPKLNDTTNSSKSR